MANKDDKKISIKDFDFKDLSLEIFDTYDSVYTKNIYEKMLKTYQENTPVNNKPYTWTINTIPTVSPSWKDYSDIYRTYEAPRLARSDGFIKVVMDDGSVEHVSREDLIKYIGERKLIESNDVVRKVYERYQVAVKLVRSDDNGDTGV